MVVRWNQYEIQLSCFMVLAVLSDIRECDSLNPEGLALLAFRERIESDPYGAFVNWDSNHSDPCLWLGVQCVDGKVQVLDLSGFSLRGTLAPTLRKLRYLKSLVMSNNRLSGSIPKEIGELKLLELLDLSHNNLSGTLPIEISAMPSLKCMLLCGNNDLHTDIPPKLGVLDCLLESECNNRMKFIENGSKDYIKRIGRCLWWRVLNQSKNYFGISSFWRAKYGRYYFTADRQHCCQIIPCSQEKSVHRRLAEESTNLVATPPKGTKPQKDSPITSTSGSLPAQQTKPSSSSMQSPTDQSSNQEAPKVQDGSKGSKESKGSSIGIIFLIAGSCIALLVFLYFAFIAFRRYQGAKVVRTKDAALLHRLSKAFVTGVPRLNSAELQTACEDFSNIIETFSGCLMYKGILSSGVEIAVLSTSIRSSQQWSSHAEREFKNKLNTLSKINHKNFVNVIGYCQEEDPFVRMMVFEYAPNGTLYEHLHVKEMEHLDWTTRMKIVMGTCYCLEHMHHDLNPPVIHPNLQSDSVLLTDDYSAKVVDLSFWGDIVSKAKISDDEELEPLHSNPGPTCEDNVYNLGILFLEIISTKSLNAQAMQYLSDKQEYSKLIDPSLKSFKNDELEAICEVILECLNDDPRQRPSTQTITSKLREVTKITPEAATSRFSPLWWAELEILSLDS